MARYFAGFAFNLAGSVYLARAVGPSQWGLYAIAFTSLLILQAIVERGTVGYLARRRDAPKPPELGTVLCVQVGVAALLIGLTLFISEHAARWTGQADFGSIVVATGVAAGSYALRAVPLGLLERSLRYGQVAVVELVDIAAFNLLAAAALGTGSGLLALALGLVGRGLGSLLVAYVLARPAILIVVRPSVLSQLARYAWPYASSNGLSWFNAAAAPVLIASYSTTTELGLLQLAATTLSYPQAFTTIVSRVAFPVYAQQNDSRDISDHVSRVTSRLLRYVGGATLLVAASSSIWVPVFLGASWYQVSWYMLALAGPYAFAASLTLVITALNSRGYVLPVLANTLVFTVIYWSVGFLLVPRVGGLGLAAAYAVAASTFAGFLALHRMFLGQLDLQSSILDLLVLCILLLMGTALWAAENPMGWFFICAAMLAWLLRGANAKSIRAEMRSLAGR